MGTSIEKHNGHKSVLELRSELAGVDSRIGRLVSTVVDMKERRKELQEAKRAKCQKEDEELSELRLSVQTAEDQLLEAIGGRKMVWALLKRAGATPDETKLDRLLANEKTASVINGVTSRTEN